MWPKNNKALAIFLAVLLVILLAAVRAFEQQLFYDPFLAFFKSNYQTQAYPDFDGLLLFVSYSFRFALNSGLSLLLLYVLFADRSVVKVASLLFGLFFIVLMLLFFGLFYSLNHPSTFMVFYVRRFLIQPLFIILFIPAFYYQKRQ